MSWIPLGVSFVAGLAIAPGAIRSLRDAGWVRENFRHLQTVFPSGIIVIAIALLALGPLALAARLGDWSLFEPGFTPALAYVVGVAVLGLADDTLGRSGQPGSPRGWRGHIRALRRGTPSTGALKALGALGLAALVLAQPPLGQDDGAGRYLLAVALLVITTNFFNLLDLRPGRAEKALVLVAVAVCLGAWTLEPLRLLGLFVGAVLVVGFHNLRERAMLGDTGSNAIGAIAGIWLVSSLSTSAQAIVVSALAIASLYGEFRSLGLIVERIPLIKHLDSLGRK